MYREDETKSEIIQKIKKERDPKLIAQEKYARLNNLKYQLEWVKRQLEYISFASKYKLKVDMKRGEVYEFDWGVNVNAEFSHRHYGVVLADSDENNPIVVVCPLKTNRYGAHPKSDVDLGYIPEIRTESKTLAVINQIRSLDKMRLYSNMIISESNKIDKIIQLNELQLRKISNALMRRFIYNTEIVDDVKTAYEESKLKQA